ncbi:MAG: PEGA domain-containing protein [bacterium]
MSYGKIISIWGLFFLLLVSYSDSSINEFVAIRPFINHTDDTVFSQIHVKLKNKLDYEMLPGDLKVILLTREDTGQYSIEIQGFIDHNPDGSILRLVLSNYVDKSEESKNIPLKNISYSEIIDIINMKVRYYLEQSFFGKLGVSSNPIDCEVLLNGIKTGRTPTEFILKRGFYKVSILGDHLYPYFDTVQIISGNNVKVHASMLFRGLPTKHLFIGSLSLSIITLITQVMESKFHTEYTEVPRFRPQQEYDLPYANWRRTAAIKVVSLNASILGWAATGYSYFRNKNLKNKIFANN